MLGARRWGPIAIVTLLLVGGLLPLTASASSVAASPTVLTVSTTNAYQFDPSTLNVQPGQAIELEVTNLAPTNHTFVLSSVANSPLPTSDTAAQVYSFFNAHPPLVNLSLGSTPGTVAFANFTAPSAGSYQFVCIIPGHLQSGMEGTLVSGSSSSGLPLTTIAIVVVIVIVLIAIVAVVVLRSKKPAPPVTP